MVSPLFIYFSGDFFLHPAIAGFFVYYYERKVVQAVYIFFPKKKGSSGVTLVHLSCIISAFRLFTILEHTGHLSAFRLCVVLHCILVNEWLRPLRVVVHLSCIINASVFLRSSAPAHVSMSQCLCLTTS